jgi:peptidoglycan hydrolase CwlO-like protein
MNHPDQSQGSEDRLSQIQVDYYENKLESMQRNLNSQYEEIESLRSELSKKDEEIKQLKEALKELLPLAVEGHDVLS